MFYLHCPSAILMTNVFVSIVSEFPFFLGGGEDIAPEKQ